MLSMGAVTIRYVNGLQFAYEILCTLHLRTEWLGITPNYLTFISQHGLGLQCFTISEIRLSNRSFARTFVKCEIYIYLEQQFSNESLFTFAKVEEL